MIRFKFLFVLLIISCSLFAADSLQFTKTEIIYGRKDGMALTMMMLKPTAKANGKAIISVLNGNWISSPRMMDAFLAKSNLYIDAGYTMFGVMVSSQPQYTIPDEISDLKRAVRFIRYNAKEYSIDADHIGITGSSAGGHLSLMIATSDDEKNIKSNDPVDKVSARVQAVAVFYPPTDFINYGGVNTTGTINQQGLVMARVAAAFDFKEWSDATGTFVSITDTKKRLEIAKEISPINWVTHDDPPVIIIHGDMDFLVPKQQSESIIEKFKEAKVPNKFIIKEGGSHGWQNREVEEKNFIDWFDKYLK
ncbi:MAG: alpha/beta hydrolase [Ferruginibacter sp.]